MPGGGCSAGPWNVRKMKRGVGLVGVRGLALERFGAGVEESLR